MDKKVSRMGVPDGDITKVWSHKHDYPIDEIWNTDNTLARLIVPRLQAFKQLDKHGYPGDFSDMRTWKKTIQKMIDAFELMKYVHSLSDDEERIVSEGLSLFCKYFRNLWD
jgi:hypothetical protein